MKEILFSFAFVFAFFWWISPPSKRYITTVSFQQTYGGGLIDTAFATIETVDSAHFVVFFERSQKYFPTGGWCIADDYGDAPAKRFYAIPAVVKIKPFSVRSSRF